MTAQWWQEIEAYKDVASEQWYGANWQMNNRIHSFEDFKYMLPELEQTLSNMGAKHEFASDGFISVTPFVCAAVGQMLNDRVSHPWFLGLLRTFLPQVLEMSAINGRSDDEDPVGEKPTGGKFEYISRFYPDRVLIHLGTECATYCRYCFRRD